METSSINCTSESMANFSNIASQKRDNIRKTLETLHAQSNSLSVQLKDLEEYFEAMSAAIVKREEEIEVKSKEIEWREKYLDKKSGDIRSKRKRLEERRKMADDQSKEIDERCEMVNKWYRKVREKEKCCDDEMEAIECEIERLRKYKRDLKRKFEKKEVKFEGRVLEIDNLEVKLELRRKKLNSIERELMVRLEEVELREKKVEERFRAFESHGAMMKSEVFDNDSDRGLVDPSYADLRFNVVMDGIGLQMFLNGRVNDHEVLKDEIITGLGMSADPAKLVLDAMVGFYPEELGTDGVCFDVDVVRKSCILLLEQLMKMKPRIRTHVRERAMRLAVGWKEKMKVYVDNDDHYSVGLGFLLIVATYGLTCGFVKDELLSLFERCAKYAGASELCCGLGLKENAHEIIQNLILGHQPLEALKLVHAFELVNVFPPIAIIKSHLTSAFQRAEEIYKDGDPPLKLQIKCISKKLSALISVVRCIKDYDLESTYPVQPLEQQILELKKQKKFKSLEFITKFKSKQKPEELDITQPPTSSSVEATTSTSTIEPSNDAYMEPDSILTSSPPVPCPSESSPSPIPSPMTYSNSNV